MIDLIKRQRDHWRWFHTSRMGSNELNVWIDTIPYEDEDLCNCQKHIYSIVAANPPRLDDWERWTWEVHNAVNKKLGKQLIAWTDAITLWDWPIAYPTSPR